jgi:LysM repeat protein
MIAPAMVGWRNPARYLAPLAIVAVAAAAYLIVHTAVAHKHTSPPLPLVQSATTSSSAATTLAPPKKFYVVQPNDTLSRIAVKTGVSLSTIERLNPSVNPDALHPSQKLRLR